MAATDTLRQTVTLTVHDTVHETTTITIQTNTEGDTTKMTTLTDRERITNQDRTALQTHATTKESTSTTPTSPIQPIIPQSSIKPLLTSFLLGLLIPLIKLCRRLKK